MTIDGIMLHAITAQLQNYIGSKVDRIFQPEKDEIILALRQKTQGNCRLLLSANASHCRVSLTTQAKPNPEHPPMFCMLLRKHLQGARIAQITQDGLERILTLRLESRSDLGDVGSYYLITETMGRHSNIILLDSNMTIVDSIKRVGETVSSVRHILPGRPYTAPPAQNKQNPLDMDSKAMQSVADAYPGNMLRTYVASKFQGVSPLAAREISHRAFGSDDFAQTLDQSQKETLGRTLSEFFGALQAKQFDPQHIYDPQGCIIGFTPFPYQQYDPSLQKSAASASAAVDRYYTYKEQGEKLRQKAQGLQKSVEARIEKLQKKLSINLDAIHQPEKAEELRLFGELLTAGLHGVSRSTTAKVLNYYSGETIEIPLDARLSPAANAQRYYKLYNKAKVAQKLAKENIGALTAELSYLEGQLYSISACTTVSELEEIRLELEEAGYLKKILTRKNKKIPPSSPLHYRSSDGLSIYVGKNNAQNDTLT
ncbi:MAG: Rqc2 family fibronectin-binding protein, partial [Christensenellales bacterium]